MKHTYRLNRTGLHGNHSDIMALVRLEGSVYFEVPDEDLKYETEVLDTHNGKILRAIITYDDEHESDDGNDQLAIGYDGEDYYSPEPPF